MPPGGTQIIQAPRWLRIQTPLGEDALLLRRLTVAETISRPFLIKAQVIAGRDNLQPADLIGKAVTCSIHRPTLPVRHFHGIVRSFGRVGLLDRGLALYQLEAVPRLWHLSRTADCRIFQETPVRGMITKLLQEAGAEPVRFGAGLPNAARPYTVQFNETDLEFLQRLLDETGCGYFFQHTASEHTMVVTGSNADFPTVPGDPPAVRQDSADAPDVLTEWRADSQIGPAAVEALDHDMLHPSTPLQRNANTVLPGRGGAGYEMFLWPGGQAVRPDADPAKLGMETAESGATSITAAGHDSGVFAGGRLKVRLDPDSAATSNYLISEVLHDAYDETHLDAGGGTGYRNSMRLIPAERTWRNPAPRPRPPMPGVQSAIVTGPSGEEVYCDEYGRVKLHFLWDRKGKRDETSSCWVRVAQPWAGDRRGFWALPRIGDEVLVAFIDGDPDRPVVIGSLHNAEAAPPFNLPDEATRSGLLSRSSKGGGVPNANMLRFEDKAGEEEVTLNAERDFVTEVERDATETIKRDSTQTVTRHRTATVTDGNDTLEVKQGNISVKASLGKITIEAMQSITLKVGPSTVVLKPEGITIEAIKIEVKGTAMVEVKAPMVQESADAMMVIKGGVVMIN